MTTVVTRMLLGNREYIDRVWVNHMLDYKFELIDHFASFELFPQNRFLGVELVGPKSMSVSMVLDAEN